MHDNGTQMGLMKWNDAIWLAKVRGLADHRGSRRVYPVMTAASREKCQFGLHRQLRRWNDMGIKSVAIFFQPLRVGLAGFTH
jgi:hypothetical protein